MPDIKKEHGALIARILQGPGVVPRSERHAAFNNERIGGPIGQLTHKVAMSPHTITDDDILAARSAGFSEDQIFELVVCAAIGEATREYERALSALEAAAAEN